MSFIDHVSSHLEGNSLGMVPAMTKHTRSKNKFENIETSHQHQSLCMTLISTKVINIYHHIVTCHYIARRTHALIEMKGFSCHNDIPMVWSHTVAILEQ